ncbi:MAG: chorismate-binding protein, partial [Microcella sp.]|uniref:chorismate-binding protein n=1 Tax=Microcella sp. TaxID=1913979 RepID=UPI00271C96C5
MPTSASSGAALRAVSEPVDDATALLEYASAAHPLVALRRGDGIVGIGEIARLSFTGPDRLARAAAAWRELSAAARVDDAVHEPGSGLVAFGAFAFADTSAVESVLIVPEIVVGRRGPVSWVTRITTDDGGRDLELAPPVATRVGARPRATLAAASLSRQEYVELVRDAVARIRSGEVEKVVMARDARASIPADADRRALLQELAEAYPDTLTFAVDGLVGASPETLVSVHAREASARVLAGSRARGAGAIDDAAAATA